MMEKFSLETTEGIRYGVKWLTHDPIANIVIFEGMEEHASRYDKFALELNKEGYNVYSLDTFGQGENAIYDGLGIWPRHGFIKQVDIYGELASHLESTTKLPLYIFAHSMGSFMGQCFLERHPGKAKKIVLCGSGAKNPALGIGHLLAKLLVHKGNENKKAKFLNNLMFANLAKSVKDRETDYDWLSYNKENVKKYIEDPLCGFGPTNGFCLSFIEGMCSLYKGKNLKKLDLDTKIFLIGGQEDPVTNMGKYTLYLNKMYMNRGVKEVSYKIYPSMRHEILNEEEWMKVTKDIISFYDK